MDNVNGSMKVRMYKCKGDKGFLGCLGVKIEGWWVLIIVKSRKKRLIFFLGLWYGLYLMCM